jgi:hypothetical protein
VADRTPDWLLHQLENGWNDRFGVPGSTSIPQPPPVQKSKRPPAHGSSQARKVSLAVMLILNSVPILIIQLLQCLLMHMTACRHDRIDATAELMDVVDHIRLLHHMMGMQGLRCHRSLDVAALLCRRTMIRYIALLLSYETTPFFSGQNTYMFGSRWLTRMLAPCCIMLYSLLMLEVLAAAML